MKRIKMITTMANDRQTFHGDSEYDVDDLTAHQAIKAGIAIEVKPKAQSVLAKAETPKPTLREPSTLCEPKSDDVEFSDKVTKAEKK